MPITLRPWQLSDLDSLVELANNHRVAKNLTNQFPYPYSRESGQKFIDYANQARPYRIRAIEYEGRAVGAVGLHPQEDIFFKNLELGYWLGEPYWGKGLMTEAVRQTVVYGFENWEVDRIFARPFGSNIGSQRVLEKAGFTFEARFDKTLFKFGQYEDELYYAIRRSDLK
ncbi:MAG: GNAT family protein [Bacteroidota bacterium]